MKKILTVFSMLLSFISSAQMRYYYGADTYKFQQIATDTMLVVLDNNFSKYNDEMEYCIKNYWTYSPYKFVRENGLADGKGEKYDKQGYTYLVRNNINGRYRNNYDNKLELLVSISKREKTGDYTEYSSAAFIDLNDVDIPESYIFCLRHIILQLQYNLNYVKDNNICNRYDIEPALIKHYNSNTHLIKQKTLYIINEFVIEDEKAEILNLFKEYNIQFVSVEEVVNVIKRQDDSICYLYVARAFTKKSILIISGGNGMVLHKCSYVLSEFGDGNKKVLAPFKEMTRLYNSMLEYQ